jgi:tetratricopeptide (TPR) repeat protein
MRLLQPAEQEYRNALALEPNDATWSSLGQLYQQAGDMTRAAGAMRSAVEISPRPHLMLVNLAFLYLGADQPEAALKTLDEAVRRAPLEASTNRLFQLDLARARASAWSALGNAQQAIAEEEAATRIAPERIDLWRELATLYELNGRTNEAIQARNRAETLQAQQTGN